MWPCSVLGLLRAQLFPWRPCLACPGTQDCCGPRFATLSDDSFPRIFKGLPGPAEGRPPVPVCQALLLSSRDIDTPPPFVGADGGSSLRLSTGNVLDDAAELLGGPGGGEPDHRRLRELPACPGPEDAAVLGSAGLGADSRNRTQVRGGAQPVLLRKGAAAFFGKPRVLICYILQGGEVGDTVYLVERDIKVNSVNRQVVGGDMIILGGRGLMKLNSNLS